MALPGAGGAERGQETQHLIIWGYDIGRFNISAYNAP